MPFGTNDYYYYESALILIVFGIASYELINALQIYRPNLFKKKKKIPKIIVKDEFDLDFDLDFSDIGFSALEKPQYKYVPETFFSKTEEKVIDETFVKEIVRKITDAMIKKSVQLKFKSYTTSQQLLTIFFTPEDVVNVNNTISYFDVGKCERALPNVKTALGSENVQFNAIANEDGEVSYSIGITNGTNLALGNLYHEFDNENLTFIVGKDANDELIYSDIARAPHLLVVGSTGSGKSSFVRQMITQFVTNKPPSELQIWASDIKLTELAALQSLPHLQTFASTLHTTIKMLDDLMALMNKRNQILLKAGSPDVLHYNYKNPNEKLPFILVLIEEFLLLTTQDKDGEAQRLLQGLLSSSRSAGIHFMIATQVANASVLPTTLRANLPAKAVFKIGNKSENSVLGTSDAHLLAGNGDMLFVQNGFSKRIQSPFISPEEFSSIINYLK